MHQWTNALTTAPCICTLERSVSVSIYYNMSYMPTCLTTHVYNTTVYYLHPGWAACLPKFEFQFNLERYAWNLPIPDLYVYWLFIHKTKRGLTEMDYTTHRDISVHVIFHESKHCLLSVLPLVPFVMLTVTGSRPRPLLLFYSTLYLSICHAAP